jgi:hypothetical protein
VYVGVLANDIPLGCPISYPRYHRHHAWCQNAEGYLNLYEWTKGQEPKWVSEKCQHFVQYNEYTFVTRESHVVDNKFNENELWVSTGGAKFEQAVFPTASSAKQNYFEIVDASEDVVRCAFSGRNLHSRMPLDPTYVRLKRTCV